MKTLLPDQQDAIDFAYEHDSSLLMRQEEAKHMMNTTEVLMQLLRDQLSIEVDISHPYNLPEVRYLEVSLLVDNVVVSSDVVELEGRRDANEDVTT